LTIILGGSGIVTCNIANHGSQYFDYGSLLLHSPWIMQDLKPKIFDALLTLSIGGSDIVTNYIANTGGQYFN